MGERPEFVRAWRGESRDTSFDLDHELTEHFRRSVATDEADQLRQFPFVEHGDRHGFGGHAAPRRGATLSKAAKSSVQSIGFATCASIPAA